MPLSTPPSRDRRGLTLVELMVALALFVIGMVGVMALFAAGVRSGREAQDTVDAATLLDAVLEDIDGYYLEKYRPVDYPRNIEGYPDQLLKANGNKMPAQAAQIQIPPTWPGRNEVAARASQATLQLTNMTYVVVFEALPNTSTPAIQNRPQCVVAHVVVYWERAGRTFQLEGKRVIQLP